MSLFQKSVINKYLKNLDNEKVSKAYKKFQKFYGDKLRLYNIMQLKEENYQEGFLREIFVETLGYTINPDNNYNLTTEFKNFNDARKADGAILSNGKAIGVIELKSTKTKNLESIKEQAFSYKNNQPGCRYVITSNFQNLRFYIDDATEFEEFNLFKLSEKDFKLFYLLLNKESIFSDLPHKLKEETKFHESDISAQLYTDYKRFKNKIFENLVKNNPQYDKLTLFKKSQKLLDRFLFVFFAEDSGLIPPNAVSKIIEQWKQLQELDEYRSLYTRFQKLFTHLDKGHKYEKWGEIPAYNGGLFRNDELLDSNELKIDDEILEKDSLILSAYDFNTEVDVDILGHIFEHSLGEIEEMEQNLSVSARPDSVSKSKVSKRKKDGIFYTPKYITKYIVENTVGTLCKEKKEELKINNILIDDNYRKTDGKLKEKGKKLFKTLNDYKDLLLTLKILDPACGSGAFLNATLDFLIAEHKQIADIIAELMGDASPLFTEIDKTILENNIYGVDINEESVEIAKLSLWLRTAQKGRPLSDLSGNIKCGNSLIDDPEVAGDKAFHWQTEFPQIFTEKKKKTWHITTATHNSRYSQRMFDNNVKTGEAIWLDEKDEIIITKTVAEIVKESKDTNNEIYLIEYNICGDHMHLLLVCEEEELTRIVGKIKGKTARLRNSNKRINPLVRLDGEKAVSLWTQKFGKSEIKNKNYLNNAIKYIRNNRIKHELPENKEIEKIKKEFLCTAEHAFRTEYKGGFDVVIGNPPWGAQLNNKELVKLCNLYPSISKTKDSYLFFIISQLKIVKLNGFFSFIVPNTWLLINSAKEFRNLILKENIIEIADYGDNVFADVTVESMILTIKNCQNKSQSVKTKRYNNQELLFEATTKKDNWIKDEYCRINIERTDEIDAFIEKLNSKSILFNEVAEIIWGIKPYQVGYGIPEQTKEIQSKRIYHSDIQIDDTWKPLLVGSNINRYSLVSTNIQYIQYGNNLMYPSNEEKMINPKILLRQTSDVLRACVDEASFYCQNSLFIITSSKFNLKYLNLLLNSRLINFVYSIYNPQSGKTFAEIKPSVVKSLPLREISKQAQQPFIEKTNKMLELNKQFQEKKTRFLNRLSDNLGATIPANGACPIDLKLSKKLERFYNYDFKTFVSELKKKKVKLSLTDQDEWEDYFTSYKTEINNLQAEISETDKEIDKMVYKLYGLTEEEISIVEESVK